MSAGGHSTSSVFKKSVAGPAQEPLQSECAGSSLEPIHDTSSVVMQYVICGAPHRQESCRVSFLTIRGLEEMTSAAFKRGCQSCD